MTDRQRPYGRRRSASPPVLLTEERFSVEAGSDTLVGWRADGDEPALVLHGGWVAADYTAPLAAELQPRFATIRYQQRGMPPSTTRGPFTVEQHLADAHGVLDSLGVERAWLVGHSWGGYLALRIAAAAPDRALGVVAVGTLGALPPDGGLAELSRNIEDRLRSEQAAALAALGPDADFNAAMPLCWRSYFADTEAAPVFPAWFTINDASSRELAASVASEFAAAPLATRVSEIACPVLFVHGRHDPLPWQAARETAALIDDAQLRIVEDSGHFLWLERPGAVGTAVGPWLAGISPATSARNPDHK